VSEIGKLNAAIELGYIVEGWYIEDYCRDAIENHGWESLCIWGPKGSLKSNLMLQLGYLIYKDWDLVLNHVVFRPRDFIRITEGEGRIPCIMWDDIGVHLPRTLYFTDRKLWSRLKSNWDAFRPKLSVFLCTTPRKEKVASFIIDDLSGEVLLGKRVGEVLINKYDFQRWLWQFDFIKPTKSRFSMVQVEKEPLPGTPKLSYGLKDKLERVLPGIPTDVFQRYYAERIELANEARLKLARQVRDLVEEEKEQWLPKELKDMTDTEKRSLAGKILRTT